MLAIMMSSIRNHFERLQYICDKVRTQGFFLSLVALYEHNSLVFTPLVKILMYFNQLLLPVRVGSRLKISGELQQQNFQLPVRIRVAN